jgi:hypothetical protein
MEWRPEMAVGVGKSQTQELKGGSRRAERMNAAADRCEPHMQPWPVLQACASPQSSDAVEGGIDPNGR